MKFFKIISLLFLLSCNSQKSKSLKKQVKFNWKTDTFNYVKETVPKEVEYGIYGELKSVTLKKTVISECDDSPVILAICAVKSSNTKKTIWSYYIINPLTDKTYFSSIIEINGCEFDIPAFVFTDLDKDGKDDFVSIESFNKECKNESWINSNFKSLNATVFKSDIDIYQKLRSNKKINKRVDKIDSEILQKTHEGVVEDI